MAKYVCSNCDSIGYDGCPNVDVFMISDCANCKYVTRPINLEKMYIHLAGNVRKTGFIDYPVTLLDGRKAVGIYKGYGAVVLVTRPPKPFEKGFRSLGPIEANRDGIVHVRD